MAPHSPTVSLQAREQEGSAYENRLETCKDEYEVMEQQLTSEIKLLRE